MKVISVLTAQSIINYLRAEATSIGVTDIANVVLNNFRFAEWSGSSVPDAHHYGDNGLLIHTNEVIALCFMNAQWAYQVHNDRPSHRELFLAALFHDVGKIWDYSKGLDGVWRDGPHKKQIHHIQRSAIEWSRAVEKTDSCRDIEDRVIHAILSHHGQKSWGSAVAPKTRLAWILHISDQFSARMDDGERNQYLLTHNS